MHTFFVMPDPEPLSTLSNPQTNADAGVAISPDSMLVAVGCVSAMPQDHHWEPRQHAWDLCSGKACKEGGKLSVCTTNFLGHKDFTCTIQDALETKTMFPGLRAHHHLSQKTDTMTTSRTYSQLFQRAKTMPLGFTVLRNAEATTVQIIVSSIILTSSTSQPSNYPKTETMPIRFLVLRSAVTMTVQFFSQLIIPETETMPVRLLSNCACKSRSRVGQSTYSGAYKHPQVLQGDGVLDTPALKAIAQERQRCGAGEHSGVWAGERLLVGEMVRCSRTRSCRRLSTVLGHVGWEPVYEEQRRLTAMIMLVPKHVQEAYMSKNMTKGLCCWTSVGRGNGTVEWGKGKAGGNMGGSKQQHQLSSSGSTASTYWNFIMQPPGPSLGVCLPSALH
ncbi:hypothetical protein B0H17DRAFT_1136761 [Mycena rosella]|uniref:Uncharacterized protein n=1 Tax=Mycena rosella TaxID=1033263 RepID=A0AAD7GBJ3_MYCRO|nr:hypothetical protein B0H17DRAFT_1136761 [Mycena rosella]